tara:strand:- start:30824 stop:31759 length:936 start_codon:yes stop_codon:yes gene_type:complete
MATLGNYYIDTINFDTATAVWTDSTFSTKAPDGWYQSCGVVREQLGGFLLPADSCPYPCSVDCGTPSIFSNNYFGVYDVETELGPGIGAVKLTFTPHQIPNGLFVTYNGTSYTGGVSNIYGYIGTPYVGTAAMFLTYGFPGGSPYLLPKYEFGGGGGTNWVSAGNETINVALPDTTGTVATPGAITMFIPKIDINPQQLTIRVVGPVGGSQDAWSVSNACPVPLVGLTVTNRFASSVAACGQPLLNTVYNGQVSGIGGVPGNFDMMFTDSNGEFTMIADGYTPGFYHYVLGGINKWFEIDANSVIINLGNC